MRDFRHLTSWKVNVGLLQERANKDLLTILDGCEGSKVIVWDESIPGQVNLVVNLQTLKDRSVGKMYSLGPDPLPRIEAKNIIFIVRATLRSMKYVAQVIQREEKEMRTKKDFFLYFLPRRSLLCQKHLEMEGVLGSLKDIGEFACDLFPLDRDLLSMEWPQCYRELYLEGDPTVLHQAACSLVNLQRIYGRIPKVCGKGDFAEKLWQMTKQMGVGDPQISEERGAIDQLIILERPIDLMTPLATQLTYEGLIDEVFGISNTTVHIPSDDKQNSATSSGDSKILFLNSEDELFAQLRDKNFNAVGQQLSRHAEMISSQMERPKDNMSEMKKFVERLPTLLAKKQSLADHTGIAERIKDVTRSTDFLDALSCEQEFMLCSEVDKPCPFIEDLIAKEAPLQTVLRLMCMQSVAGTGLRQKVFDHYKRELAQTYGIDCLLTIGNLERAGLLRLQTAGTRTYAMLRKALNLTVEDFSEVSPKDISYVHSFYAPMTIRLVENFLRPGGWLAMSDVMARIPGATFEDVQKVASDTGMRRNSISSEVSGSEENTRVILVFFVGGCTFAEVSALRFLGQQPQNNVEFLVATTKVINKNTFLEPYIEKYSR